MNTNIFKIAFTSDPIRSFAFVLVFLFTATTAKSVDDRPLNEKATAAAWEALNGEQFEAAIKHADECIDEFRGAARRLQEKLEKDKATLPTGTVDEQQKQKIFSNGLLNDVGTCYFIKGKAAEKLGRKDDAMHAYEEAKKLTYARTWDPNGWFWSPSEGAADRLDAIR
jgi:tetratricopeptide (TPR) repeat protein